MPGAFALVCRISSVVKGAVWQIAVSRRRIQGAQWAPLPGKWAETSAPCAVQHEPEIQTVITYTGGWKQKNWGTRSIQDIAVPWLGNQQHSGAGRLHKLGKNTTWNCCIPYLDTQVRSPAILLIPTSCKRQKTLGSLPFTWETKSSGILAPAWPKRWLLQEGEPVMGSTLSIAAFQIHQKYNILM